MTSPLVARRSERNEKEPNVSPAVSVPVLAEFEDAAAALAGVITHTPLDESLHLTDLLGVPVHLKLENLQRTGSFKIRGAAYRLSRLTPEERARGVVAASAGNHAQGVALAAQSLGIAATIFMPLGVPVPKLLATRGYGADVILEGATVETPLRLAAEFAERTGAVLIHPFDHRDIVVGQGTLGLELYEDFPEVETVLVGIGGGGLAAGVAAAVKARAAVDGRSVRVIGVQAENSAAYPSSLELGRPEEVATKPTIADGIAVARPGDVPFALIRELVDEVVTVTDDDIARALLVLLERAKQVVEPAGAVGVAAILAGKVQGTGPTVSILSGGNIDPLLLQRVVSHGLSASGRYMTLQIPLPDRPGQLARVSELLAQAGANVIEVLHTRHGQGLQISEVILQLSVETRGQEHRAHVIQTLADAGYAPTVVPD
ncbi:threonine ammonia-lyase [Microbacterium sp. BK668]|uniref:threonine ammonia-lyase n=1 Tax=Microbacterium sp. BK668 TaxID=2512118 RepID=UPI001061DB39|nr:threonine ammonia-lyase [Microbacterium sp. BK668]TDN92406.1 L-threonine ammonia-lyase [Microbacterium sp. BK668]